MVFLAIGLAFPVGAAEKNIPSPKEFLGHNIGDDYYLANFIGLESYWANLARLSDRIKLETIGQSAEGRNIPMAIITSPDNHKRLARYKIHFTTLALADSIEDEARRLADRGQSRHLDRRRSARHRSGRRPTGHRAGLPDGQPQRTRKPCVFWMMSFCWPPSPIPMEWSLSPTGTCGNPIRKTVHTRYSPPLPEICRPRQQSRFLYVTQPETEAVNRILYRVWFPQVVYNHHQTGPAGPFFSLPLFGNPTTMSLIPSSRW